MKQLMQKSLLGMLCLTLLPPASLKNQGPYHTQTLSTIRPFFFRQTSRFSSEIPERFP